MPALLEATEELRPVARILDDALARVRQRLDEQLESDLPPVRSLCAHVERYRGKMLRPSVVVLSGLAADPRSPGGVRPEMVTEAHVTVGAVCELVHMATLVHDDVLDEAGTRRGGPTVNELRGNEAAVILGDYLIASAFHLCSGLESTSAARLIGSVSMTTCSGELLQLHHRDDFSLDEATYFEIVGRKTASLIGAAAELGAGYAGGSEGVCTALGDAGRLLGVAFQIQDDVLDLTGVERIVGKSLGKDLEKGKLTLPLIHHLESLSPSGRGEALALLEEACQRGSGDAGRRAVAALETTGSIRYARRAAEDLIRRAKTLLATLPATPARRYLLWLADTVVSRTR